MPVAYTEGFANARTNPAGEPELILPLDVPSGTFQLRHQMVLDLAVDIPPGGFGISAFDKPYTYYWRIMDGATIWFEQRVTLVITLTALSAGGFGGADLSLTSWAPKSETIQTTIIEGVPTDENRSITNNSINGVPYDNTDPHPLPYTDAFGRVIDSQRAAFEALQNPAFKHTYSGSTLSEFGILIEDGNAHGGGVGVGSAVIMAAHYGPIYRMTVRPGMMVDIIQDTMQSRYLREALYQFKFTPSQPNDQITALIDMFNQMHITVYDPTAHTVIMRAARPGFIDFDSRDIQLNESVPSYVEDRHHQFWLARNDTVNKVYEEILSQNEGMTFKRYDTGIIYKGMLDMAITFRVDEETRGCVYFDGKVLYYKNSGDNWAAAVPIAEFEIKSPDPTATNPIQVADRVQPMGAVADKGGVIHVENGRGLHFESPNHGSSWSNLSIPGVIT